MIICPVIQSIEASQLNPKTKQGYISIINKIKEYCKETNFKKIYDNPQKYKDCIIENCLKNKRQTTKSSGLSTCREYVNVVKSASRYANLGNDSKYEKWKSIYIELANQVDKEREESRKKAGVLDWKQIMDAYEDLHKNNYASLEHVTLALYVLITTRRQMDFWLLYIQTDKDETIPDDITALLKLDKTLEIYKYKTVKHHGVQIITVPDELFDSIHAFMKSKNTKNGYLFTMKGVKSDSDKPYSTEASFTLANNKVLKKIFNNKSVSVNSIRHAASTFSNTLDYETQKKVAKEMGHSMEMHEYYKNEVKDPKDWYDLIRTRARSS